MSISVGWAWFVNVTYTDATCTTQTTMLSMSKAGTYVSDPYAGAFPETLYLKSASVRPRYALPAGTVCNIPYMSDFFPGDFALPSICPLSYEPDGTLTPPFEIPTTISIQRYA